jgi:L-alanine-DL-glutamate epimerase-like enolase superfamily enzyme
MTIPRRVRIEALTATPLSVPLREPFVIASGRIDVTRAVLVEVALRDLTSGQIATGLGEAAALPPVTREDQPDLIDTFRTLALVGDELSLDSALAALSEHLDARIVDRPVARCGLETALLDSIARLAGVPLRVLLGGDAARPFRALVTDITLPIADPARMADGARAWWAQGFRSFKVKVGQDRDRDLRALEAIHRATPEATLRLDANGGFGARDAIAVLRGIERLGVVVECYEQPCAENDLDAMKEVADAVAPPVLADESVRTLADLERVRSKRAADGVNLKLAKSGGPLAAFAIGRAARAAGMPVMCGGMVETRLGMSAAAHVATALGGVDFVDLDTAWLLAEERFFGGYLAEGPRYLVSDEPGIGVSTSSPRI